jgi:hypothetical protein
MNFTLGIGQCILCQMHYFVEYLLYLLGKSYFVISWVITRIVRRLYPESLIWIRNSTHFGYCLFGLSDIDVTVVSREPKPILSFLKKAKTIFKMIGEVNVYHPDYLEVIQRQANFFEMKRDPYLKDYLSYKETKTEHLKAQAIVFYLRMLDSDCHNLKKRSWLRRRKWAHHRKMVEEFLEYAVLEEVSTGGDVRFRAPHQWLNKNYDQESLEKLSRDIITEKDSMIAIYIEQIAWEVCGVWTQKEALCHQQVTQHFINLKVLLRHLCEQDNQRSLSLVKDINYLLPFFDKE